MRTILMLVIAAPAFGQEFEVAAIKPSAPPVNGLSSSRTSVATDTGQFEYSNVSLKEIVRRAYNVQSYQVSGPPHLETERFDVVAKFQPGSTVEQVRAMLQALLVGRFHMVIHRETRELPAYALTAVSPELKAIESAGDNLSSSSNRTGVRLSAKTTMRGFAEFLSQNLDRPVLDQTRMNGGFEFTVDWARDDSVDANGAATGPSIFTAVQEQLGLKLNATKGPVETIAVDKIERFPTEN